MWKVSQEFWLINEATLLTTLRVTEWPPVWRHSALVKIRGRLIGWR